MNIEEVDISDALVEKIVSQVFPAINQLHIVGLGEALCSRHFWPIVEECSRQNIQVCLTTNGILLNDSAADKLGAAGSKVVLSLDGRSNETLNHIRPGIRVETMERAMAALQTAQQKYQSVTRFNWSTHTVMVKSNIAELNDIIMWAGSYGCRHFSLGEFDIIGRDDPFSKESLVNNPAIYKDVYEKLRSVVDDLHAELLFPDALISSDSSSGVSTGFGKKPGRYYQKCPSPWRECNILVNGDVYACCIMGPDPLGNLNDDPFRQIWNNSHYRRFRRIIHSGHPAVQCRHCPKEWGITAGNTRYFDDYKKLMT